jgi:signal transduction histidine kinase
VSSLEAKAPRFTRNSVKGPVAWELGRLALVAVGYWIAAKLSLNLALVHGQVTPIWPPTGIALVAILVLGRRASAAIALAAFAVNLPIGPSPLGAALIAAGNTAAPLLAAELLKRLRFHPELDRLRDAAAIVLVGALGGMAISATVGSSVLVLFGSIASGDFWSAWAVWWAGDAMGVLLVAPFLLCLMRRADMPAFGWARSLELVALLGLTALLTYFLFHNRLRLEYFVFPLIMAAAWRFGLWGAAPAALFASGVAIWSAVTGSGPFAEESLPAKMITLQAFNVSVALASFVLASFVETRRRQEEVSRLYLSAQMTSEAKSDFLHMAAHELRTPISVFTGYLSLLRGGTFGPPPPTWEGPLDILVEKAGELDHIVDDLLQAARIESSATSLESRQVDVCDVARAALERSRARANLLGADLDLDLPAEPVSVAVDAVKVGRILDNLINNALSYAAGPPRVALEVATEDGQAVIRVRDNGVGIAASQRELVFDRFYRSSDPANHVVPGTGLGLYIGRQLALAHGGSLRVEESEVGRGTTFALRLPLAGDRASPQPVAGPAPAARDAARAEPLTSV